VRTASSALSVSASQPVIALSVAEQFEAAAEAARRALGGGKIYSLLT
jgi:hypothetical protein